MTKLTKHCLRLEEGQLEELAQLHPNLPASAILRQLIAAYIRKRKGEEPKTLLQIDLEVE